MTPERWHQVKALLQSALELEPDRRSTYLAEMCANDKSLRKDLESFILSHEQAANFIDSPAFELLAESLTGSEALSLVGQSLGYYRVLAHLCTGGMGEVYLAEDTRLGRKVALKTLPVLFTGDSERLSRFQQEARAASALNHPNILTIYEIEKIDSREFIASEFIDGETLRQRIAGERMTITEALDVVIQIASALSAAHHAGITHRDIKPENIMLRQDGLVKVLDFGLAKLGEPLWNTADSATLFKTKPGMMMGTTSYMSPEQARGKEIDKRTDIFSLGVVLYELVTGSLPFEGDSVSDIIVSILEKEPAPLSHYRPEAPEELERIVTKALRKDIAERYQTSTELIFDLKNLKEQLEFQAKLASSQPPDSRGLPASSGQVAGARASSVILSAPERSRHYKTGLIAVAALAALLIAGIVYTAFREKNQPIDSLAILPFINESADPNSEYLSDGITESIIFSTSQLSNLKVMSRSSVFRYKGREIDPRTVAKELGVRAVMTGRVLQRGDGLSISAELIDVRDNRVLWGQQYNRKIADVIAVQEEISREISDKLRLKLTGEDQKRLTKRYTDNTEAYQLYLKGRYHWNKRTEEGYQKGIEQFRLAIEKDPNYALAYTGLADCYLLRGRFGTVPPRETMAHAKEAARKALELDDNLAEAHTSAAYIKKEYDWDFPAAEKGLKRAIELNSNYATAQFWYAIFLAETFGRYDEALAQLKRAQELDPTSLIISTDIGMILYLARRYDQAIEQCQKTLEMDPNFFRARLWLGRAFERKGMYQAAIAEFRKARELDDKPIVLSCLGQTYAAAGQHSDAHKAIEELERLGKQIYVDSYYVASIHAALGDRDRAFAVLERAYGERSSWLSRLKVDPIFDPLRGDPRFKDLLQRIGFQD